MRSVLITGGARGIGKATADLFRSRGYDVTSPTRSELDLADELSVDKFVANNASVTFDIVINNAGINDLNLIENVSDEELERMIMVNFTSHLKLLRAFVPKMKKQNYGRIVNIGSIWAIVSKPERGLYAAMKNALHGITNTLALEGGPYNILVNTVCPGFTLTELTRQNNSTAQIEALSQAIPLQRMATPDEIAEVIYFLCSEHNGYLTGQKICVDGGYTIQ